jgi:predicted metal-binding protein
MYSGIKLLTSTPNRTVEVIFKYTAVEAAEIIKYMDCFKFRELCKNGCCNYRKKWSCPPFASSYEEYAENFKYLGICLLSANMSQFSDIKNDYLKIRAANTVLKSRIDKMLFSLCQNGERYLSPGSCRLCSSCKCKKGEKCPRPDMIPFSFEALGIDVGSMTLELFGHRLLWYKKGSVPEYTTVVGGILANKPMDYNAILNTLRAFL